MQAETAHCRYALPRVAGMGITMAYEQGIAKHITSWFGSARSRWSNKLMVLEREARQSSKAGSRQSSGLPACVALPAEPAARARPAGLGEQKQWHDAAHASRSMRACKMRAAPAEKVKGQ
eukprot:332986-Pelagomonas_calceolata.AAC.11